MTDPIASRDEPDEMEVSPKPVIRVPEAGLLAVVERLQGRLNTLERENARLRRRSEGLFGFEEKVAASLAVQQRELEAIREQIAFLRQENAELRERMVMTGRRGSSGFLRRIGKRLPDSLRVPLRHVAYRSLALVAPNSPLVHAYRQSCINTGMSAKAQRKLFDEIMASKQEGQLDVVMMPVIDWHFRIQRPQHIAACLGQLGHRVFYLTTIFGGHGGRPGFHVLESPEENVFIVQLHCPEPHPENIYARPPSKDVADELAAGLALFYENFHVERSIAIVQQPFWASVARRLPGSLVVYDCMDYHGGFTTHTDLMGAEEDQLLKNADLVVTTALGLSERVGVPNVVIRNAAEVDHFIRQPEKLSLPKERPVVGYYGAIASWFDMDLLVAMARRFPEWDFVLVGSTYESNTTIAEGLPNVQFTGEVPYADLPGYLHAFDVCTIPFQITDLTLCTNPVKVYEYLCAGKPVVSTELPEVMQMDDHVHIASTHDEFAARLEAAMEERHDEEIMQRRINWAREQNWSERGQAYEEAIEESYPKVSVVVLSYNNVDLLKACLHSLEKYSSYPNLELIVVDNASDDATRAFLAEYETARPLANVGDVKVIFNEENLGFAAGNNVGIKQAKGEYVILLNNDTYVTRGWVLDMIRHLRLDPGLGLVGAVTNNIGNEAKIDIDYADMNEMASAARTYTMAHASESISVNCVAFFCVGMRRSLIDAVGLLDEVYARGFFEDDDYCNRVRQAGLRVAIADDVFVHHHLSASFGAIDQTERQQLFDENKRIYESKWGPWKPHVYRREG
ncbi:MAG: glycosyltransferase [Planctomycetota bacterium]|nr:glycosyltransferase [Planctomycetota bacterium]